jgi:hypothetical protein
LEVQPAVYTKEQDKKIPNGRFVTMTGSRPELNKQANVNINENKEMNSYVAQQMENTVPSANHSENPLPVYSKPNTVPLSKHLETQRKLDIAQAQIIELTKVNKQMGEEMKLLQSMLQRLTSENSMLLQMQGKPSPLPTANPTSGPTSGPPRLIRATTAPLLPLNKQEVSSTQLEATEELHEDSVDGRESQEVPSESGACTYDHLPETAFQEKQREATEKKESPPSLPIKKKRTRVLSVDTPPPALSATSQSALLAVQKQQLKQQQESEPVNSSVLIRRQQTMPTMSSKAAADAIVQQTEQITKRIQELLMAAQHGQPANFVPCSRRISSSVNDMAALFPQVQVVQFIVCFLVCDGNFWKARTI